MKKIVVVLLFFLVFGLSGVSAFSFGETPKAWWGNYQQPEPISWY